MIYNRTEQDLIVADSMGELNYKQKKMFIASLDAQNPQNKNYANTLIKTLGEGVYNKIKAQFFDEALRQKILEDVRKRGVVCITLKSEGYPEQLKSIPIPPLVLYLRGNAALLEDRLFAVVGSRKSTKQSLETCKNICGELTRHFTIITGVADGGDSAAISGALSSGRLICVLPFGHDGQTQVSTQLLREIERRALTVSEFPPETPAQRYTFLLRNRVIAGLCEGVLVVSAAQKSGALNTAAYAADYGRDVFALPYFAGTECGKGCNQLIKNGAMLCEGAADIFSTFGLEIAEERKEELSEDEKSLLELLRQEGELHAEKISAAIGKKLFEVMAICSMLEIKGLIIKTGGNRYCAI